MYNIILVTGATTGIGRATAIYLASKSYTVYGAGRRTDKLEDLKQYNIHPIKMDVTDEASIQDGINTIMNEHGCIDILINNAGFGAYGTVEEMSMKDAHYQFDVNVFGVARLIQLVLPKMREQRFGKIVNISSIAGKMGAPYGAWYHASKFAIEGLSDSLRLEVKEFGIDVIIIEPGGVQSEWAEIALNHLKENTKIPAYKSNAEKFAASLSKTLHLNAPPESIAKLIYKSITAKRPKARYAGGFMAKPTILSRKYLPDWVFDKILLGLMK